MCVISARAISHVRYFRAAMYTLCAAAYNSYMICETECGAVSPTGSKWLHSHLYTHAEGMLMGDK